MIYDPIKGPFHCAWTSILNVTSNSLLLHIIKFSDMYIIAVASIRIRIEKIFQYIHIICHNDSIHHFEILLRASIAAEINRNASEFDIHDWCRLNICVQGMIPVQISLASQIPLILYAVPARGGTMPPIKLNGWLWRCGAQCE